MWGLILGLEQIFWHSHLLSFIFSDKDILHIYPSTVNLRCIIAHIRYDNVHMRMLMHAHYEM